MEERKIKVKVVNESDNGLPEYETLGSAAMDIRAAENIIIKANSHGLVKTGLKVEIPEGYKISVLPRSGLALRDGITVLNTPGTIDADYRGEIGIILHNTNENEDFYVSKGDRIAQIEVSPVYKIHWEPVIALNESSRGEGGFGSTGVE